MTRRITIPCHDGRRHRWAWVDGAMSGPGHVYFEQACIRCRVWRSEA